MGWAGGSYLAEEIWDEFRDFIQENQRKKLANWLYERFCNEDADDWSDSYLIQDAEINKEN